MGLPEDDLYVLNAMALFGVARHEVTVEQRREAKRLTLIAWAEGVVNGPIEFAAPGQSRCGRTRGGRPCCLRVGHTSRACCYVANPSTN